MPKISKATGTYVRSYDFPDIGDYTYSELKKSYEVYRQLVRNKGVCTVQDIQHHFRCPPHKARMLLAAAEFSDKMRKKGIA